MQLVCSRTWAASEEHSCTNTLRVQPKAAAQTYPNMAGEIGNVDKRLEAEMSSETDISGLGLDCHVNKAKKSVRLADGDKETV